MNKKIDKQSQTESFRIDTTVLDIVREVKRITGMPMASFIEKSIMSGVKKLPKSVQEKITVYTESES